MFILGEIDRIKIRVYSYYLNDVGNWEVKKGTIVYSRDSY